MYTPQQSRTLGDDNDLPKPTPLKAAFIFNFPSSGTSTDRDGECVDITFPTVQGRPSPHKARICLHDYSNIYTHRGLYESLFRLRLQCCSPQELVSLLSSCVEPGKASESAKHLQILDVGAGNGMVGQELRLQLQGRIGSLVGTDILPNARAAALRDRPKIYDQYIVADLLTDCKKLGPKHGFYDVLSICASFGPGLGEVLVRALWNVLQLLNDGGLLALTINEKWLGKKHTDPRSKRDGDLWDGFVAILGGTAATPSWAGFHVLRKKKIRRRLDMRGEWIWHLAFVLQKTSSNNERDGDAQNHPT